MWYLYAPMNVTKYSAEMDYQGSYFAPVQLIVLLLVSKENDMEPC
jgi:hypothetical protein